MIDWKRISELREEIGEEDFNEVAEVFLEEVDEAVERLADATEPAQLAAELHFLKGSALNLGFSVMAELCQTGEAAANRGEPVDFQPVVATYQASRAELMTKLG